MELKDKKIVVTGGGGFLGSRVVEALVQRGVVRENVIVPLRETHDLRDRKTCRELVKGANLVIHVAGITGDAVFHREHAGEMFHDNLLMGAELMEASRLAGAEKFVGIGSATEYPVSAPMPLKEDVLWQGPLAPSHAPYSFAKKMMLVQGTAYKAQYGFTALHLMPTNMYGPGERLDNGFVIPMFIKRFLDAKRDGAPTVIAWGTGASTRDFLYVDDAAEGILLAAERCESPEAVNLGSGREVSIKQLAELLKTLTGYEGELVWDTTKPDGEPRRVLNVDKAFHEFGFKAATTLEFGLRNTLDWYTQRT